MHSVRFLCFLPVDAGCGHTQAHNFYELETVVVTTSSVISVKQLSILQQLSQDAARTSWDAKNALINGTSDGIPRSCPTCQAR